VLRPLVVVPPLLVLGRAHQEAPRRYHHHLRAPRRFDIAEDSTGAEPPVASRQSA
jgi:hypothetical protein